MKVLVLGASGMLGNAMIRVLLQHPNLEVYGTLRSESARRFFGPELQSRLLTGVDVQDHDGLVRLLTQTRPNVVVNCVGLVKQLAEADDPLLALPINAMLPHRLARLCALSNARLVHVSTDCVFTGRQGLYTETDEPDAQDLYGRSKLLGEVAAPNAITLRTSIIGHELSSRHGLVEWFLAQEGSARGFTRAIFSGLPTCELARVTRDFVLTRPELSGVYHVASAPIAKYDLLKLINEQYGTSIVLEPDDKLVIDRSLVAARFNAATGYHPPDWPLLVASMNSFR
ncbi:dTDP-4-dehydrorhamnose reductase family protein [Devosia beringensis]|uniref:dTDP-4-dehydrorhamnose reductase family protein n=1 Tax=Devosia beringensis TaxID=2657486 RepID=UPI00186B68B2|nr:SDR family oxidoreductase [Devosia beringensis]